MLKIHIQLFAESEGGAPAEPEARPEGAKTFSEDYVKALRGESAGYRTRAKAAEAALREVLGLGETEALGDLSARVAGYRDAQRRPPPRRRSTTGWSAPQSARTAATTRSCSSGSSTARRSPSPTTARSRGWKRPPRPLRRNTRR